MRRIILSLGVVALLVSLGVSQPLGVGKNEKRAPNVGPHVFRATATEVKGEVVVQVACPNIRLPYDADNKPLKGTVYVWEEIKPLTLGKEVNAYNRAGKPLGKEAVLKALAKPTMAVCFVRSNGTIPRSPTRRIWRCSARRQSSSSITPRTSFGDVNEQSPPHRAGFDDQ